MKITDEDLIVGNAPCATVVTYIDPTDKNTIKRLAKEEGVSLSAWIREAILQRLRSHK